MTIIFPSSNVHSMFATLSTITSPGWGHFQFQHPFPERGKAFTWRQIRKRRGAIHRTSGGSQVDCCLILYEDMNLHGTSVVTSSICWLRSIKNLILVGVYSSSKDQNMMLFPGASMILLSSRLFTIIKFKVLGTGNKNSLNFNLRLAALLCS